MVTGINTDVRVGDRVYHVQTQDLGARRCVLESLVYVGGEVLDTIESRYDDIADSSHQVIHRRLVAQHRSVISSISEGKYSTPPPQLEAPPPQEAPDLVVTEIEDCFVGDRGSLMVLLRTKTSFQPLPGAEVEVFYPPSPVPQNRIYCSRTDLKGFHVADFRVPHASSPDAFLLVRATCPSGSVDARVKVFQPAGERAGRPERPQDAPAAEALGTGGLDRPSLVVSELDEPRPGATASFLLLLQEEVSQHPIPGARVCAQLRVEGRAMKVLYEAVTDATGFNLAEFRIPAAGPGRASLLIQATCGLGAAEVILPLS